MVSAQGSWFAPLIDISLKGALLERSDKWEANFGDRFLLELSLGDAEHTISMEGEIAHVEGNHVGLKCLHIGLDSITHLRRLIELNLGDESVLDRELSSLIEEHRPE